VGKRAEAGRRNLDLAPVMDSGPTGDSPRAEPADRRVPGAREFPAGPVKPWRRGRGVLSAGCGRQAGVAATAKAFSWAAAGGAVTGNTDLTPGSSTR